MCHPAIDCESVGRSEASKARRALIRFHQGSPELIGVRSALQTFLSSIVHCEALAPSTRASTRAPPWSSTLPNLSTAVRSSSQGEWVTGGSSGGASRERTAVGAAGVTKKHAGEPSMGLPSSSTCTV